MEVMMVRGEENQGSGKCSHVEKKVTIMRKNQFLILPRAYSIPLRQAPPPIHLEAENASETLHNVQSHSILPGSRSRCALFVCRLNRAWVWECICDIIENISVVGGGEAGGSSGLFLHQKFCQSVDSWVDFEHFGIGRVRKEREKNVYFHSAQLAGSPFTQQTVFLIYF